MASRTLTGANLDNKASKPQQAIQLLASSCWCLLSIPSVTAVVAIRYTSPETSRWLLFDEDKKDTLVSTSPGLLLLYYCFFSFHQFRGQMCRAAGQGLIDTSSLQEGILLRSCNFLYQQAQYVALLPDTTPADEVGAVKSPLFGTHVQ